MDIQTTILGFLNWKSFSGYELKKIFTTLDFLPWSGNNNQIYKALVSLEQEEYVNKETINQENAPAKKIYTITSKGKEVLINNLKTTISMPTIQNDFILNLAWADILDNKEFNKLLDAYQENVELELKSTKEKAHRKDVDPARTEREEYIWDMIWQYRISFYRNELNWLLKLRNGMENK